MEIFASSHGNLMEIFASSHGNLMEIFASSHGNLMEIFASSHGNLMEIFASSHGNLMEIFASSHGNLMEIFASSHGNLMEIFASSHGNLMEIFASSQGNLMEIFASSHGNEMNACALAVVETMSPTRQFPPLHAADVSRGTEMPIQSGVSGVAGKRPTDYNMWEYSEQASYVLYILAIIFQICFFFGVPLSATIVTLITMERFVAVFYPLRFTSIVTKNRAWMAVAMSYILWIPYPVYISTFYRFLYREIIAWDLYVGNASFLPNDVIVFIELNLVTPLGSYIPFILVTGGSLLIALRVKVTMKKRQTMVSASAKTSAKTSKTTTTLLTVCVVFSVTKFASVMAYVVDYTNQESAEVVNLRLTLGIVTILLDILNASSNFIIYIVCNKKFRTTVKEMIKHK
ncbi:G-protein coupled receptor F59B2.13 [Biomphalaria glabrata]|nr:G-protein coupled receptor F59B2.13 [Biomphalaria glabrata]